MTVTLSTPECAMSRRQRYALNRVMCRHIIVSRAFVICSGLRCICQWLTTNHSAVTPCTLHSHLRGLLTCPVACCAACTACLQLSEIVSRTRTIKAAVEAAVSKQFAGRRVNVLGEINNALAASA